jgi:hypothetical protein
MTQKWSLPLISNKMVWVWVTDRAKKIKPIRLNMRSSLKA